MNTFQLTDQMLDRLVDGELAGDEYREVLARLEIEPDGWRRCALAFLESQAWRRDFAPPRTELRAAKDAAVASPLPAKPASTDTNWLALLGAMAASFLLAFGLGWGFGGRSDDSPREVPGAAVVAHQPKIDPAEKPAMQPAIDPTTPVAQHSPANHQGEITLLVEDSQGKQQQVQLPVTEVSSAADVARSLNASVLPARIREALERSGHRVVRQQQVIPIELEDGRQLVMPVEDVRVMPIAATYQ